MFGLMSRTGVQGFFCVFKSDPDLPCTPRWYFTTPMINYYLMQTLRRGWDVEKIGALAEAFAVAGCNFMSTSCTCSVHVSVLIYAEFLSTAKQRADFLKAEIRDLIQRQLGA